MSAVDKILGEPCAWLTEHESAEIAISSRIRLARNVSELPFPTAADESTLSSLGQELQTTLRALDRFGEGSVCSLAELDELERGQLFERSLVSSELAGHPRSGAAVAISPDQEHVVMVMEEDHLRLQVMKSGLQLEQAWKEMAELDEAVEREVPYAFDAQLGYLTSCPTNTGTGLRAGVMLQLPGLALQDEIEPVVRGLAHLGCAVRGIGGEGSDADAHLYQVSNQVTLGQTETDIIENLNKVVVELIEHEGNARLRLDRQRQAYLCDQVARAWAVLTHAWILPSKEALALLGMIRLGLAMGLLESDDSRVVERLMVDIRPAHLQVQAGKRLSPEERDRFRAGVVRSKLADLRKGDKLKES